MRRSFRITTSLLAAVPLLGATVAGTWSPRCLVQKPGESIFWPYVASDSPIVQTSVSTTVCLESDNAADGSGAATATIRWQPGGSGPDENISIAVEDSNGTTLTASDPCKAVPAGNFWIEGGTACATTCSVSVVGRND